MDTQTLRPRKKILNIKGKFSYCESIQAWNTIRFKKELINEFPQLREKLSKFIYDIILYEDYEDLEKAVRKMKIDKEALPILLWLRREKN